MDEDPKAKSKSVSFLPDLWVTVEEIAGKRYGGNRSAYLRELVERDLNGISIGTPQSAFSLDDVAAFHRSEAALLRAEILAREYLFSDESSRAAVARKLCEHVMNATRRNLEYQDHKPLEVMAAEDAGAIPGPSPAAAAAARAVQEERLRKRPERKADRLAGKS